jgi:hypothetical protein
MINLRFSKIPVEPVSASQEMTVPWSVLALAVFEVPRVIVLNVELRFRVMSSADSEHESSEFWLQQT